MYMKKNVLKHLLLVCCCFYFQASFAQPANDGCSGATNIPVVAGSTVSAVGTVEAATQTTIPNNNCVTNEIANVANDVWFSFTAVTSSVTITVTPSTIVTPLLRLDPALEVFRGNCLISSSISCMDNGGGAGRPETISNLSVTIGNTYYIRVYHFTQNSIRPTVPAFTVSILSIPPLTLPTPTNVTATTAANNQDITIRWSAVTGASEYALYDERETLIQDNITPTSFLHTNRPSGEHCYKVKACNNAGLCSNFSSQACATIIDRSPPTTPQNLVVSGNTCSSVVVSWNRVGNATSYKLYSAAGVLLTTTTDLTFTHTGLTLSTTYCYKVKAVNTYGESALSTQSCGSPRIEPPVVTANIVSLSRLRLTWQPVCGATKYFVYNSNGQVLSNGNGITGTSILLTNLAANQQYCYTVKACNNTNLCSNLSMPVCETMELRYIDVGAIRFTADNIEADANEEVFTLTGTVRAGLINSYPNARIARFTGTVAVNTTAFTFSGTGAIIIENGLNGSDFTLLNRTYNYSVLNAVSSLLTRNLKSSYKLAGFELELDKITLLPDGINIKGDLEFPILSKKLNNNVQLKAEIEELQIRQGRYPQFAAELDLGDIKFKGYGLKGTKVNFNGINQTIAGQTTLTTPIFKLKSSIKFENRALESLQLQYTPTSPVPLGTTGLSLRSIGGGANNISSDDRPLEIKVNAALVPTITQRMTDLQLIVEGKYKAGTSFSLGGTLKLFNQTFANGGFTMRGNDENRGATEVETHVGIEFCIMSAQLKANFARNNLSGEFASNFKLPCPSCLPLPSFLRTALSWWSCGQNLMTTKSILTNRNLAGYAKIPVGQGWLSFNLEAYYIISSERMQLLNNYNQLPWDFRNHFSHNPFEMIQDTTWYAYNVNVATQSLIIEAFGGLMDVPKFWIRTSENDTITKQNVSSYNYVKYYEDPNTHYAAYYFDNPRNGDYFVGVINADSIKVNTALVRPSIALTQVQHNVANRTFTLQWKDECPDRDALITLGYSTDTEGSNQVILADSISENSPIDTYTWQYNNELKTGQYYFWALIQDSIGLFRKVYYPTPFAVTALNTPTAPSNLTYTLQQDTVALNWVGNNPYPITYIVYYSHQPNTVSTYSKNFAVINDTTIANSDFIAGRYYEFIVTALDTFGNESAPSNRVSCSFHPNNVNNVPFITSVQQLDITYLNNRYATNITAQDLDNQPLRYELAIYPNGMNIHSGTGLITWTPSRTQLGLHLVKVKAIDSQGAMDSLTYQVQVLDTAAATAVVQFNKALYLGYDDEASVYVRDDDFGGSPNTIDSFAVRLYSTTDRSGFIAYMTEIGLNSREFVSHFGFSNTSSGNSRLLVNRGDTVWVEFMDRSMQQRVRDFSYFTEVKADFRTPPHLCSGDSIRIENKSTGSGLKYLWDFGDGTFSNLKHPTHTYSRIYGGNPRIFDVRLNVTDADGRTSTITKPLTIIPLPIGLFGDTINTCDSARLDAGNTNSQYLWHNQETTQQIRLDSSQQIWVRIQNTYGCVNTDTADLRVWKIKTRVSQNLAATCEGNDGLIALATTGGSNQYTYSWLTTLRTTQPSTLLSAGNYAVTVTDTIYGCSYIQNVVIPLNNNLAIDPIAPFALNCFGDRNGILRVNVTTPRTIQYRWNDTLSQQTNTLRNVGAGHYTVSITTPGGCSDTRTGQITQPTRLSIDTIRQNAIACTPRSGSIVATITGGINNYQYRWNTGANTHNLDSLANGIYTLTVTDAHNCQQVKSIEVTQVMPEMTVQLSKVDLRCHGDANGHILIDQVRGGWGVPYSYSLNDVGYMYTMQNSYKELSGGNYTVYIKDKKGCKISRQVQIYEPPLLQLDAGTPRDLDLGQTTELSVRQQPNIPVSWQWSPNHGLECEVCQTTIAKPLRTTNYIVAATDRNGCVTKDTVRINVKNKRRVFIPTHFTPNNDGNNDKFIVHAGIEVKLVRKFEIYTKWGNRIFAVKDVLPNNPDVGWDGMIDGQSAGVNTYLYIVEIEYINGTLEQFEGTVEIIL